MSYVVPFAMLFGLKSSLLSIYSLFNVSKMDDEVVPPPGYVSIIATGWYEDDDVLRMSLESILNQNVVRRYPDQFELVFVGCGGINTDIPRELGFEVLCSPRGKLIARQIGIDNSSGDIIVSVDTDSIYPVNWLNLMLKPYYRYRDVVATTSTTWQGIFDIIAHDLVLLFYQGKILGRGSTFLREAYYRVGGFNIYVDYTDPKALLFEEEYNFRRKLEKIGKVVTVDAPIIHLGYSHDRGIWTNKWE